MGSKINTILRDKLFSTNESTAISAVTELQSEGNKLYLPILFELLLSTKTEKLKNEILKLLGTVKDKETIPTFIEALENDKFKAIRKDILVTCWQNGLDFSDYFRVFVNIIIKDEWANAFEAFTVIENLEYFPPKEEFKTIKLEIANALKTVDEQKAYFLEEILKI